MIRVEIEENSIDTMIALHSQLPEFDRSLSSLDIERRLQKSRSLLLIATFDDMPIGYKIGYSLSDTVFYSWLGGVLPDYRRHGIANKMRQTQEQWAVSQGFTHIKVKSMNRFPAMICMLIQHGYHIVDCENRQSSIHSKIVFSKALNR